MKTLYLILASSFFISISQAQFTKGDKLLGGSFGIGYGSSKTGDADKNTQKGFSIGLSPSYAWFTSSTTALGFKLNGSYGHSKSDGTLPTSSGHSSAYGGSLFFQKYKNLDSRLSLYAEFGASGSYSSSTSKTLYSGQTSESKGSSWNAGVYVTPGILYKLTQRLLLDVSLNSLLSFNYGKGKSSDQNGNSYKSSGFSIGSSFNNSSTATGVGVGFKWLLK